MSVDNDSVMAALAEVLRKMDEFAPAIEQLNRRLDLEEQRRTAEVEATRQFTAERAEKERSDRRRSFAVAAALVLVLAAGGFGSFRSYTSNTCNSANRARMGLRAAFDDALVRVGADIDAKPSALDPIRADVRATLLRAQPIRNCPGILP